MKIKKSKQKNENKKGSSLEIAVWAFAIVLIIVFFLASLPQIKQSLKATDFFKKTIGTTPAFVQNAPEIEQQQKIKKNDVEPVQTIDLNENSLTENSTGDEKKYISQIENSSVSASNELTKKQSEKAKEAPPVQQKKEEPKEEKTVQKPVVKKPEPVQPVEQKMTLQLCFMNISGSGSVSRMIVSRQMKKSSSPLVDSVNALILGPNEKEESQGCRSLISGGTKLIGASIKDGTATLNFSGEFEFNQYGIEGLRGQLQQIVYTATAFNTVNNVQFLVDGEKKDYLGSEGVWIGTPLDRESF